MIRIFNIYFSPMVSKIEFLLLFPHYCKHYILTHPIVVNYSLSTKDAWTEETDLSLLTHLSFLTFCKFKPGELSQSAVFLDPLHINQKIDYKDNRENDVSAVSTNYDENGEVSFNVIDSNL